VYSGATATGAAVVGEALATAADVAAAAPGALEAALGDDGGATTPFPATGEGCAEAAPGAPDFAGEPKAWS
jgi:hypothetical protein